MSEECRLAFEAAFELLQEKCAVPGSEDCKLAFEASHELVGEKCGTRKVYFEDVGLSKEVSTDVTEILGKNPELTREQRIKAISESAWAQGWGKGICNLVTGEASPECVARMSRILAERTV